jgi:hypothetical protein
MIMARRMRWSGIVACMGARNACKSLPWKHWWKRAIGRKRVRWTVNP